MQALYNPALDRLVLAGSTDEAEVALFSRDELPADASPAGLDRMAEDGSALRLPAGADGGYLLHLYVDEEPPPEIAAWLDADDSLEYEFATDTGAIAFGGVESAHDGFRADESIRTDAEIPAGRYKAVAFHTSYPDERIEEALVLKLGESGANKVHRPARVLVAAALLFVTLVIMGFADSAWYFAAAAAVAAAAAIWTRTMTDTAEFRRLKAEKDAIEREFPSIVITLERITSAGATG